jgi:methyltransferase
MLTRLLVCSAMGLARLAELRLSRSNLSESDDAREGGWSRRSYPVMVALHATTIAGTAVVGGRTRPGWLGVLFAMQPLRVWTLLTLRSRWNTRGAVSSSTVVETGGPYAFVRHPNYLVVFIELLALPLAFGLRRLALGVAVVHIAVLALRIRDEERLLEALPGYRAHFGDKARFIPRVF